MGGALKAISKIAGPIMQVASMFTPMGAIMGIVSKGLELFKGISGALKSVAPKAAANLDQKLNKVQNFAQNAIGKANQFLTGVGNAVAFGDVDGNGLADLAIGFSGQPSVVLFLNTGTPPADDTIFADGFD